MLRTGLLCAVLGAFGIAQPSAAADFSDPTWPCIQRKVEQLSVGLMWPHPIDETPLEGEVAEDVSELAQRLALRRLDLEAVRPDVEAFVAKHGADLTLLGHVYDQTFTSLARTRRAIMEGIADYSLSQIALAERIEGARIEMNTLMDADEPDFDKVDALEAQVDWDERIYNDRRQSLTYVCETPVLLEKRLFETAQMLLSVAEGG